MSPDFSANELETFVTHTFAAQVGLEPQELADPTLTLSVLITKSAVLTNSIDLMEAFAKVANVIRKQHGIRVQLPALPLDTPVQTVLSVFMNKALGREVA